MKTKKFSLYEIREKLGADVYDAQGKVSDAKLKKIFITSVSSLEGATSNDITFYSGKEKHKDLLFKTKARACLITSEFLQKINESELDQELCLVVVKNVFVAYAKLMNLFYPDERELRHFISKDASVDETASIGKNCEIMFGSYIGKNAKIGDNVKIYPSVYIGDGVEIGDNCILHHCVTIIHASLGNDIIIHSGTRIGQDGFKYVTDDRGVHIKVPHIGRVRIGNDVEIGANCAIDRGVMSDTIIGSMCKLDNLVQIGHNVVLGRGCILVSQVGIAGSTVLGDYVAIGGQGGVADHVTLGSHTKVAAQSGIMRDTPDGAIVMGSPAQPVREFFKQVAMLKKLIKRKEHG